MGQAMMCLMALMVLMLFMPNNMPKVCQSMCLKAVLKGVC
ncbi:hypothetical protein AO368_0913 [Moraxella catarrhalis]|nr:hypothetical protein AO368_0913 [Moraxella catarrhalis]